MSDDAGSAPRSAVTGAARNAWRLASAIGSDQFMLWLGVTFVLIAPTTVGLITSNSTIAWVAAVCGAFVTLISRCASLTELSLGPVKAKMREVNESLTVAQDKVAAVQVEAEALPNSPSKDQITMTTNAAMEAVTAAIKANNAIALTTSTPAYHIVTSSALHPGAALAMAVQRGADHPKPQEEK